jgi:hypothetical protein
MVTMATLVYEIVLTRVFSVTMGYHFAFASISIALFGLTVGALIVHLNPKRFRSENVRRDLWVAALGFAVSVVVCFAIQLDIAFKPHFSSSGVGSVVAICTLIAIPFTFSGVVVCLALTRFPERVNRLYAADLVGAASGTLVLAILLNHIDASSVVIAVGGIAAVGALSFARDAGNLRAVIAASLVAVSLISFTALNAILHEDGDPVLDIVWQRESKDSSYLFDGWSTLARLTVSGDAKAEVPPFYWGVDRSKVPADLRVSQLRVTLDGVADTVFTKYDGDPKSTDFLRYDISNLGHYVKRGGDMLVIGAGGGRDVLSGLEFKQKSVTAVEINQQILDLLEHRFGDFTGHLDRDPRVKFVHDEARSYVTRSGRKFQTIQLSLIDTFAAGSAGAYALTENSLYTTDGWNTFLDHLDKHGVLSVSRWWKFRGEGPLEVYRSVAIASQVLTDRGVQNPRDHILVYRAPETPDFGQVATVLVSPSPFTAQDRARAAAAAEKLGFTAVLTPDHAINHRFADLAKPGGPSDALHEFTHDVSPPTDSRPFFFQMVKLSRLLGGDEFHDTYVTRPVIVLALLAVTVMFLTLLCIGGPLLLSAVRSRRGGAKPPRGMVPYYLYFGAIGLGFLLVEVSQLFRLSVFLGHPIYALTVVLFAILLFSGLGSMLSERLMDVTKKAYGVGPLAALLGVLVLYGIVTGPILDAADEATTPVRILVAVLVLFPIGVFMGMPLAVGMKVVTTRVDGAPTAFLWGINGAMSVTASVLGMVFALFFGITVAFWIGFGAYAVAAAALLFAVRRRTTEAPQLVSTVEEAKTPTLAPAGADPSSA